MLEEQWVSNAKIMSDQQRVIEKYHSIFSREIVKAHWCRKMRYKRGHRDQHSRDEQRFLKKIRNDPDAVCGCCDNEIKIWLYRDIKATLL